MKKLLYLLIPVIIIVISFVACSSKIAYTNEFQYLPAIKNMVLDKFEEQKNNDYGTATYTVKAKKFEDILNNYEKILIKDGWKITQNGKPNTLTAEKDSHIVILMTQEFIKDSKEFKLTILSK